MYLTDFIMKKTKRHIPFSVVLFPPDNNIPKLKMNENEDIKFSAHDTFLE